MVDASETLRFGWQGYPPEALAVWGARWIIDQDGLVDQLPDRQDCIGDDVHQIRLLNHLNLEAGDRVRAHLSTLLRAGSVRTDQRTCIALYGDDDVTAVGSPQRSCGYFYVAVWLNFGVTPESQHEAMKAWGRRFGLPESEEAPCQ